MTLTPDERSQLMERLKTFHYNAICNWLVLNFTPERYKAGNADCVEAACNMLFAMYSPYPDVAHTIFFINGLWAASGELPEVCYNIDSYGRLTSTVPNYKKPGVRERVQKQVDEMEPSEEMLHKWGRG